MTARSEFRWGPRALSPRNCAPERGLMGGEGPEWPGGPNQTGTRVSRREDVHRVLAGAGALSRGIDGPRITSSPAADRDRMIVHDGSNSERRMLNLADRGWA